MQKQSKLFHPTNLDIINLVSIIEWNKVKLKVFDIRE